MSESMDPLHHPDLVELSYRLREQLDAVLEAEQAAAAASRRRRRQLRDRLLEAEDRSEDITTIDVAGTVRAGVVSAVGMDHIVLDDRVYVALTHCSIVEFPS